MNQKLPPGLRLRLPATSANLGPAFDTAAVALQLHLEIVATPAAAFTVAAAGRDFAACGRLENNLILETYRAALEQNRRSIVPLRLQVDNRIPLGMGCGSSAAARLAGLALAAHFGDLGWSDLDILTQAALLEGHPDNVSACWLGGMTVAAMPDPISLTGATCNPLRVARFDIPPNWRAAVVIPRDPIRTEESRRVLPEQYSRADVVANLQNCSLLVAAFAAGDGDLLRAAARDCLHEPYRQAICPLLEPLLALNRSSHPLAVSLSGAGPGVLLIATGSLCQAELEALVLESLERSAPPNPQIEILPCGLESLGAQRSVHYW